MPAEINPRSDSLRPFSSDPFPTLPPKAKHNPVVYAFMALQVVSMLAGAIFFLIFVSPGLDQYQVHGYVIVALMLLSSLASWATHIYILHKMKKHL